MRLDLSEMAPWDGSQTPPPSRRGPRFKVRRVDGWRYDGFGTKKPPQASFMVIDTAVCCRTVAEYQSETKLGRPGKKAGGTLGLGIEGAKRAAVNHARRLNAAAL